MSKHIRIQFDDFVPLTQQEMAESLGISLARQKQIEAAIFAKLREEFAARGITGASFEQVLRVLREIA